jgi:tetratricopeptide (TPR) repeat protein
VQAAAWHSAGAALLARTRARSTGYPLVNLGVALLDLGKPTEALAQLQRGIDLLQAELPSDHADLPLATLDLANALAGTGDWTAAGARYQEVLDIWEERLPPEHPLLAYALTGLARARLELDDASAAIDPLERALELRKDSREDGLNLAETSWLLARALLASGSDEARAIELATGALATVGVAPVTDPLELRRLISDGSLLGVTDRLTPASLAVTDRTPLGVP